MNGFYKEINALMDDIFTFKVTEREVKKKLLELEQKYGTDYFPSIHFQKKDPPWNKAYLRELKDLHIDGAGSQEFILHMAEVSEYIAKRRRRMGRIILAVCVGAAVIVLLSVLGGVV